MYVLQTQRSLSYCVAFIFILFSQLQFILQLQRCPGLGIFVRKPQSPQYIFCLVLCLCSISLYLLPFVDNNVRPFFDNNVRPFFLLQCTLCIERKYALYVVLPTKSKRYFQVMGIKSKNDKIDAKALARMGLEQRLSLWQPLSPNIYRLRLLARQLEDFNKQRTVFLNQSHALDHSAHPVKEVVRSLKKMFRALEKGIEELEAAIEILIEQDEVLHSKAQKILSIKGIGLKTIAVLIAETNGFATFENQGQLVM